MATSYGALAGAQFVPRHLDLSWANDEGVKSSFMRYQDGAPIEFVSGYAPTPENRSATSVDIASIGTGTTDPFLAMLAPLATGTLRDACSGERRIFAVRDKGIKASPRGLPRTSSTCRAPLSAKQKLLINALCH